MNIDIPITPETEAQLRKEAEAFGTDMAEYVKSLIEQRPIPPNGSHIEPGADARIADLNRFVARVREQSTFPPGYLVDDRRESIYEGRGG